MDQSNVIDEQQYRLSFRWDELDKWLEDNRNTELSHTDGYAFLRSFGPDEGFDEWLKEYRGALKDRYDCAIKALLESTRR